MIPQDQAAREAAIDPTQSFIVQAPAGSGKTELLTQRYLNLLAHAVTQPEQIIAITFTRKAAAEMKHRILRALDTATQPCPDAPHAQTTWRLAKAVCDKSQRVDWQLQDNPNRLRIMTIDALCGYLARQQPDRANINPQINITQHPDALYRAAAEACIQEPAMVDLLCHLDNHAEKLIQLFMALLACREQWLPYLLSDDSEVMRSKMTACLHQLAANAIDAIHHQLDENEHTDIASLAAVAAQHLHAEDPSHPMRHCLQRPTDTASSYHWWQAIADWLLTQTGQWRRSITKRQGFPPQSTHKSEMVALLHRLASRDDLAAALHALRTAPPLHYSDGQWDILHLLIQQLPRLAAHLTHIQNTSNETDFVGLSLAALTALGDACAPTEQALKLDYTIRHLLVDEFQDTSALQYALITRLTAGWGQDDQKTIFVVGDPMQSIYRFRNAQVGLFLRTQQHGLSDNPLTALQLSQNFRADRSLVTWTNQHFARIFPRTADPAMGGVPFCSSTGHRDTHGHVTWHIQTSKDADHEASAVAQVAASLIGKGSIAILIRSRSHLPAILDALKAAQLPFHGVDLQPLASCRAVTDLHMLMRALSHRADTLAWLAILRAPFCGLTLHDLTHIATAKSGSILSTLCNLDQCDLSADGLLRVTHLKQHLMQADAQRGRIRLSARLKTLWHALDAHRLYDDPDQTAINCADYLSLIETSDAGKTMLDIDAVETELADRYVRPQAIHPDAIHIMTIHKAKGLEFDHVLLPGLHRAAARDKRQLLKWFEFIDPSSAQPTHVLAPLPAAREPEDPLYRALGEIDAKKAAYEMARHLYVAVTRAKTGLHAFATVQVDGDTLRKPNASSFLALLWPDAQHHCPIPDMEPADDTITEPTTIPPLYRKPSADCVINADVVTEEAIISPPQIQLSHYVDRTIGTVMHRIIETKTRYNHIDPACWTQWLRAAGLTGSTLAQAQVRLEHAITTMQQDPRGQWLLRADHEWDHCEWAIAHREDGQVRQWVIDRCFIDDGRCWIIDYKLGLPPGSEARYQQQLIQYGRALRALTTLPIHLGLYVPPQAVWRTWALDDLEQSAPQAPTTPAMIDL